MKRCHNTQSELSGKTDVKLTIDQNIFQQPKVLKVNLPRISKSVIERDYKMSSLSDNCQKKYDSSNAHFTDACQKVNKSLPDTKFELIDLCSSDSDVSIEELSESQELIMKTHDNYIGHPS